MSSWLSRPCQLCAALPRHSAPRLPFSESDRQDACDIDGHAIAWAFRFLPLMPELFTIFCHACRTSGLSDERPCWRASTISSLAEHSSCRMQSACSAYVRSGVSKPDPIVDDAASASVQEVLVEMHCRVPHFYKNVVGRELQLKLSQSLLAEFLDV